MCGMHNNYLSSSLNVVSFDLDTSWASSSWDPAYNFRQERARFQQKQLQEKEEKLLKLYEEQQERAMQRVGTRVQSGGSSVSSTSSVGVGKVRQMFQARRGDSEVRLGRDKSYPLKPIAKQSTTRTRSLDVQHKNSGTTSISSTGGSYQKRGVSLERHNSEHDFQAYLKGLDEQFIEDKVLGIRGPEKPEKPAKPEKPKSNLLYFGGSHNDLRFSDELDFGQSFQVIDDHYDNFKIDSRKNGFEGRKFDDDFFVKSFNNKRQFYESRVTGASDESLNHSSHLNQLNQSNQSQPFNKLPNVGLSSSFSMNQINQKTETVTPGKYKTYVNGNGLNKKNNVRNGAIPLRTNLAPRQTNGPAQTSRTNGAAGSPVRKTTPMPSAVAPQQHLIQKESRRGNLTKAESIPEVTPPIPASRTSVPRPSSMQKSGPTKMPASKPAHKPASSGSSSKVASQQDLANCKICGRHFASDRLVKHEAICQKSSGTKRKVFDAVQQRVRGTEAEKFVRKGPRPGAQSGKTSRGSLQTSWRKKHEEFINSIRAAKEVQAHLKKGGKLSDLPPPPPSDYSDYIQCPHCNRKFNNVAAERHIPKCATMMHNKPNPSLQKRQQPCTPKGSRVHGQISAPIRGQK